MKKTVCLLLAATVLSFIACNEDREPIDTMYSGFMTGYTNSDGYLYLLKDDFGRQFQVVSGDEGKHKPDTLYRLVTSLAVNDNGKANLLQAVQALSYVAPQDTIIHDSLKVRDPLMVNTYYIGGGYLNLTLAIKVKTEGTRHSLLYTYSNAAGKPLFRIYHNDYGDEPVYTKNAFVSIPLNKYSLSKNDTVLIIYMSYDQDCLLKLIYK